MSATVRLFRSDAGCFLLVLAAALVLCATGLGRRDLWDPDEPRTALATAGIVKTRDWSVLRQDGRIWIEKPPLYYWLAAGTSIAAGRVDEQTVRLPTNVAAVLAALIVFLIGRDFWGRRAGTLAALVLLTTRGFAVEARWARPDMLLALLMTFALLCAWKALRESSAVGWSAGFWGALGLAVLTKGPVGLLPLLGLLVFLAGTRRLGALRRMGALWGPPLALTPVILWLLAWRDDGGNLFPIGAALARFGQRVSVGLHHPHAPVHLLTTLPLALMPWVMLMPAAAIETFPRRGGARDDRSVLLYSFLIAYGMMFAMSAEKRGIYLLPILPLAALLIGRLWDLALFGWDPPPAGLATRLGFLAWAVAVAAGSAYYLPRIAGAEPALLAPARLLAVGAFVTAALAAALWRWLGAGGSISLFALGAAVSVLVVALAVMPALDRYKSARGLAVEIAAAAGTANVGIHPDAHAGLSWYSGRPLTLLPDPGSLAAFLRAPHRSLAVVEGDTWDALRRSGTVPGTEVRRGTVGHRGFVLVTGQAAGPAPSGTAP